MAAQDPTNPAAGIQGQLQAFQELAGHAQGNGSDTTSPVIFNPESGGLVSNPGYLNPLQQIQYLLASNPTSPQAMRLLEAQTEAQNFQQMQTLVPTADLQNYRNAQGQPAPQGLTYAELQDMGYFPQTAAQQQSTLQTSNAMQALRSAQQATQNTNSLTTALGDVLGKLGLGSIANLLPGYANYQTQVASVPTSVPSLPGVNLQSIFQNPGPVQGSGYSGLQGLLQGSINQQSPGSQYSTVQPPQASPGASFPSMAALHSLNQTPQNPYDSTANQVVNPSQLGANARASQGL